MDPLDDAFRKLAEKIFLPLMAYQREIDEGVV